jgi:hypothetical protein
MTVPAADTPRHDSGIVARSLGARVTMQAVGDRVRRVLPAYLWRGTAVVAGGYLLLYVVIALWRLNHPFELNWMEGAMVDHVRRIVDGEQLYVAPTLTFVPFIYPPAFYYVSAAVAQVTGVDFVALRLVSIVSSLGVFVLVYAFVARETGDRLAALAASGMFAATYSLGGTYLDVGRVDSFFLVLLLGAMYLLRFHASLVAHVVSALLVALAFHTKQSAVVMAAPVLLWAVFRDPRRGAIAAVLAGVATYGAALAIDAAHDGWYRYYVFDIPSGIQLFLPRLVDFWRVDVLPPLAISWAVGLLYLLLPGPRRSRGFYLAMTAGLVAGAWIPRANLGGNDNVLIPAFLASSVLFGLGLHACRSRLASAPASTRRPAEIWLATVCLLQFVTLSYNPRHRLPTRADAEAGEQLVRRLSAVEGDVWLPYHGAIASLSGKRPYAHWMAITQILEREDDPLRDVLRREIDAAIGTRRFGLIVMSSTPFANSPALAPYYAPAGEAIEDSDVLWPVAGARRRVETMYIPR